jgi:hypothetical protein
MRKTSDATLELALGPSSYQTQKKYELAKGATLSAGRLISSSRRIRISRPLSQVNRFRWPGKERTQV